MRKIVAGAAMVLSAAVLTGCTATAQQAANTQPTTVSKPGEAEIKALFTEWNASLATLDPQKVADHYAPDGVLLPTVSNKVRTDRAGIVDYFQHFLEGHPQGEILESRVKVLDEDDAIDTGTYRFHLTDAAGAKSSVDARYTFVYEKIDGQWKIVNHHSSAMPEKS